VTVKLKLGGLLWVVVAAVAALIGAARGLLDGDTLELAHESLDLVVGAGDDIGAGVDDGVFDLVSVELDRGSPEGLVGVLVSPGDGTSELGVVNVADIEGGLATAAKGELEGAGLDGVLLLGGPDEGVLLDVEATVFGSGEGEAKSAAIATVKVAIAMTDGDIGSLDTTDGDLVGIQITSHMLRAIGEIELLVEIL